ncbi:MAG TPA: response regulator [Acidimicrobiales bacterium]|nr:response regulator [Acidimicrobiales bacterium]
MAEVLVVDDEPEIRQILTYMLEFAGHEVRTATNGEEAIAALEVRPPDCVILDVMMPRLDGFGVLRVRRERKLAPSARVILLTAMSGERDHMRGWELGADDYVVKPFDSEQLIDRVEELLRSTPGELAARRRVEQEQSALLERVETAFSRSTLTRRRGPGR